MKVIIGIFASMARMGGTPVGIKHVTGAQIVFSACLALNCLTIVMMLGAPLGLSHLFQANGELFIPLVLFSIYAIIFFLLYRVRTLASTRIREAGPVTYFEHIRVIAYVAGSIVAVSAAAGLVSTVST